MTQLANRRFRLRSGVRSATGRSMPSGRDLAQFADSPAVSILTSLIFRPNMMSRTELARALRPFVLDMLYDTAAVNQSASDAAPYYCIGMNAVARAIEFAGREQVSLHTRSLTWHAEVTFVSEPGGVEAGPVMAENNGTLGYVVGGEQHYDTAAMAHLDRLTAVGVKCSHHQARPITNDAGMVFELDVHRQPADCVLMWDCSGRLDYGCIGQRTERTFKVHLCVVGRGSGRTMLRRMQRVKAYADAVVGAGAPFGQR